MSNATFLARLAVSAVIVGWMQWGPIAHQLLGYRIGTGMMTWRMYYGAARDVCDVRYHVVNAAGERRFVDRFEALGYDHVWDAKRSVRRINDRAHIERQGRQICREHLSLGEHLEADARCASYKGWKPEVFEAPICRGAIRPGQDRPPPRRRERRGQP